MKRPSPAFEYEMRELDQIRGIHLDQDKYRTWIAWSYRLEQLPRLERVPLWLCAVCIAVAYLLGRFLQ